VHTVALTFDDGPDEVYTPRLLDLLSRSGAAATFFPIAPRAEAHPALIERMLEEGHTVGVHCDVHEHYAEHDRAWCEDDVDRALSRLHALGVDPIHWRTPYGDLTPWLPAVAAKRRLRVVGWDVDTRDWRGGSGSKMFGTTRDQLVPGAVVLAHDGIGPGSKRNDAAETLAYVQLVIAYARVRELKLTGLS
jgi:peptidoglycan-N-acetylglucosamine deacetylase